MIWIIELDKITDETPGTVLVKRTKVTEQTSIDHNKTGNWQNTY